MNELKIVCLMNELLGHRKSRAVPKGPCCHLELDRRVRALESSVADGLRNQGVWFTGFSEGSKLAINAI
jgi:hypothetical protein